VLAADPADRRFVKAREQTSRSIVSTILSSPLLGGAASSCIVGMACE
jgi:hypothetical protein